MHRTICFVIFSIFLFKTHAFDGIAGCGGFVSYSPEMEKLITKKIDYSVVKTKLLTLDGATKEVTECAPNGYYFLPAYEEGEFKILIEGPKGWIFEPQEVSVTIGKDGECHPSNNAQDGQDINFYFTGFTLSGKTVHSPCNGKDSSSSGGPEGIEVHLQVVNSAEDKSKAPTRSTFTNAQGEYAFSRIYPGTYRLTASHPRWELAQNSLDVKVEWDNQVVSSPFRVTAYDVTGRVEADKEGVQGVQMLLYSSSSSALPCSVPTQLPSEKEIPGMEKGMVPKCEAITESDGSFSFLLPCGDYVLLPRFPLSTFPTPYDVSPSSLPLHVPQGSLALPSPFQVRGFSVTGKVVNSKGEGVKGVAILVNGEIRGTSGGDGSYRLEGMTSGKYRVEAQKEHYSWPSQNLAIHPSSPKLPDIVVEKYALCGSLVIPETGSHTLILRDSQKTEIDRKTTSDKQFCFLVVPGTYYVEPLVSEAEKRAGKILTPSLFKATVASAPVLDVRFSRSKVTLSGHVTCLEGPCPALPVTLSNGESSESVVTADGKFFFPEVIPGKYKLSVSKEANWCWDHDPLEVEIQVENVTGVKVAQSGYLLRMEISHPINLAVHLKGHKEQDSFQLSQGLNRFCLPKAGEYLLEPQSCYKFGEKEYHYSTASPRVLHLEASHYRLKGTLSLSGKDSKDPKGLAVTLRKQKPSGEVSVDHVTPTRTSETSFEYSDWVQRGDVVEVVPSADTLLFYPPSRTVNLPSYECPPPVPTIEGRSGVYLTGKTEPPVGEVKVQAKEKDSQNIVKETSTSSNGHFSLGPLYDSQEYSLELSKLGYEFEESSNGVFKAHKLGQLKVNVRESGSQSSLAQVLLSLSSPHYRSNNVTDASGAFTFYSLSPGQYFLRPHLKEYAFEPSSQQVELSDGMEADVSFSAIRKAFSVYGEVKTLGGGVPQEGVTIEAKGKNGQEQAQTDANGHFRIRGLEPNQSYVLRVKESPSIDRAVPKERHVTMETKDMMGIDFVVLPMPSHRTLGVQVNTSSEWANGLQIRVIPSGETAPLRVASVGPSGFVDIRSLPPNQYVVELVVPTVQDYDTKIPSQKVDLRSISQGQISFNLNPQLKSGALTDGAQANLLSLLMGLLGLIFVLYHRTIVAGLRGELFQKPKGEESSVWLPTHVRHFGKKNK